MANVLSGLDVLVRDGMAPLLGKRVALLGHPASVDRDLVHLVDRCREHGVQLVRLFGPEHGILGDAQDMAHVQGGADRRTGLPVVSLYGNTRDSLFLKPEMLDGVDLLVCDLQDIGCRYYTFAYTIAFALRACARAGVKALVLDRPNPIDGVHVEGNVTAPGQRSFVGEYALANRHGLTLGELVPFFIEADAKECPTQPQVETVFMQGWNRAMSFADTGLPWVLPSPNMPTPETALVYPGACLFEGTNMSEGRGTTRPFELIGAPFITDPHRFAALASAQGLAGVVLRPCFFRPTFQKHAGQLCGGVQIHIVDPARFDALRTGVALLHAARTFDGFDWRRTTYEYVSDRLAVDLLFGSPAPRATLEANGSVDDVMQTMASDATAFASVRARHLHPSYGVTA